MASSGTVHGTVAEPSATTLPAASRAHGLGYADLAERVEDGRAAIVAGSAG